MPTGFAMLGVWVCLASPLYIQRLTYSSDLRIIYSAAALSLMNMFLNSNMFTSHKLTLSICKQGRIYERFSKGGAGFLVTLMLLGVSF